MGRWKLGEGGAYYDSQDSGPDQVTPPPAAPQPPAGIVLDSTGRTTENDGWGRDWKNGWPTSDGVVEGGATDQMPDGTLPDIPRQGGTPSPMEPWQGPVTIDFGQDGGYQWGSPNDPQRRLGSASQLLEWLRSLGIGKSLGEGMGGKLHVEPKVPGASIGSPLLSRQGGNGSLSAPVSGMARGGMTALGKGATALGSLGRGLFGR